MLAINLNTALVHMYEHSEIVDLLSEAVYALPDGIEVPTTELDSFKTLRDLALVLEQLQHECTDEPDMHEAALENAVTLIAHLKSVKLQLSILERVSAYFGSGVQPALNSIVNDIEAGSFADDTEAWSYFMLHLSTITLRQSMTGEFMDSRITDIVHAVANICQKAYAEFTVPALDIQIVDVPDASVVQTLSHWFEAAYAK